MTSIKRNREILDDKYKHYSDGEIKEINDGANMLASIFIEGILEKKEISQNENENYESNEQCNN